MMNDFKPIYATNTIDTNPSSQASAGKDDEQDLLRTLRGMENTIQQLDLNQSDRNSSSKGITVNANSKPIPQMVLSTDKYA